MRTVVLGVALAFIALLAFLTLFVLFSSGPDVLVVISLGRPGALRVRDRRRARQPLTSADP